MADIVNLREKYPELLKDCFDLSIGPGWVPLLDMALSALMLRKKQLQGIVDQATTYLNGPYWTQSLLDDAKKDLAEYENSLPQIYQVKEKFGSLRVYYKSESVGVRLVFNYASLVADNTCEDCGTNQEVSRNSDGWMRTLCPACRCKPEV